MISSSQLDSNKKFARLEISLAALLKGLSYLMLLLVLLILMLFYSIFSSMSRNSGAPEVTSLVEVPIRSLRSEPPSNAQSEIQRTEYQDQQLNLGNAQADQSQRLLEETKRQLEDTQRQLLVALEDSQGQIQSAPEDAQGQLQLDIEREEEQERFRLEIDELREEARARQEESQDILEEIQRQLAIAQEQQLQLVGQIEILQVEIVNNLRPEGTSQDNAQPISQSSANNDPVEIVKEELIARPSQEYPRRALSRNIEGSCEVMFTVSISGTVVDPVIVDCEREGYFGEASLKAVADFEYSPRVVDGVPVPVSGVKFVFRYSLHN